MKILIVEDDIKLRNELQLFLNNNSYEVTCLEDFNDAIKSILNIHCDLILLDINLPILNGELICKELKKKIMTPIIMITSQNTEIDELLSLNYGADDFVAKPFNPQILLARINRLLVPNQIQLLKYQDSNIDLLTSTIKRNNQEIELSKNELKILCFLVKNIKKIVSRDDLMDYLWDSDEFID